ncbi:MAG: amidohydrolase family protein [Lachnospiraceae bacterium]|nr:amidohydrolase family protein [Lachnospiraceae bacterium]
MKQVIIKNIGTFLTGDSSNPVSDADAILIEDGMIAAIGQWETVKDKAGDDSTCVIDAKGITAAPGFFDSHVHVTIGDYGHRQKADGFIASELHGGVTSVISAGEAHMPGRPTDPEGVKAMAVLCAKSFAKNPPSSVKVHGGALILEKGLCEADFAYLQSQGVWIVGEIGLGSVKDPKEASVMTAWAHKYGFKVQMHTGGTSIPGSSTVTAEDVIKTKPDVVSHLNGGPTSVSKQEVDRIMDETEFALELVQCGNFKMMDYCLRRASEKKMLDRIIFGNDAPSGTGIIPLGIIRNICFAASVSDIAPEQAICMATGNTARTYGLNTGILAVGREADIVLMDAPMGSVGANALEAIRCGDIPGISKVLINGEVVVGKSKNTPPAKTQAVIC